MVPAALTTFAAPAGRSSADRRCFVIAASLTLCSIVTTLLRYPAVTTNSGLCSAPVPSSSSISAIVSSSYRNVAATTGIRSVDRQSCLRRVSFAGKSMISLYRAYVSTGFSR